MINTLTIFLSDKEAADQLREDLHNEIQESNNTKEENMNNTITLTDEQMEALKSGKSITINPPKKSLWKPKQGEWSINLVLDDAYISVNDEIRRLAGLSYQTEEDAKEVAAHLRSTARQYAWLKEHNPTYISTCIYDNNQYYIQLDYSDLQYKVNYVFKYKTLGVVYMDKESAEKLCKALNSGEVML